MSEIKEIQDTISEEIKKPTGNEVEKVTDEKKSDGKPNGGVEEQPEISIVNKVQDIQAKGWAEVNQMREEFSPDENTRNSVIQGVNIEEAKINGVREDVIDNPDYFTANRGDGEYKIKWQGNERGAVEGTEGRLGVDEGFEPLEVGDTFTRYGSLDGAVLTSEGTSFEKTSLPWEKGESHNLELVEELPEDIVVLKGEVAEGFGDGNGGGEQYYFGRENPNYDANDTGSKQYIDVPISDLIYSGYFKEI